MQIDIKEMKHIICFSGGKDSIALVLHLLFIEKVPSEQIELHHHEVDGHGENLFDWACTTSYCKAFAKHFDLPIYFSYREGGILREMNRKNEGLQDVLYQDIPDGPFIRLKSREGNSTRLKFPAVAADLRTRWCSSAAKIDVMRRVIGNSPRFAEGTIIVHTGERWEESTNRSKYNREEPYIGNTKLRTVIQRRDIIHYTERMVWALIGEHKIQVHPCYEIGWNRCSCQICIFSDADTWASIGEISPDKILKVKDKEDEFGFTLYKGEDIVTKKLRGYSFVDEVMFARWKPELLGEFTSPLYNCDWKTPIGAFKTEKAGSV